MRNVVTLIFIVVLAIACSKKKQSPPKVPIVTTDSVINITETTATVYGTVHSADEQVSYERGARYGYTSDFFPGGALSTFGNVGSFSVELTALEPQTPYYVVVYITELTGNTSAVGETIDFKTK